MLDNKKLELEYPCHWEYKVIINIESCIETIVKNVIKDKEFVFRKSHASKNNKYQTYNVKLLVHNEEERTEIFYLLKKDENVKIVL
jgi:putative lipoic acid-binding regulatory protein